MVTRWVLLLPMIGLLSACAAVPTGPSVMVWPGVGKPFDQFQVDDMLCRQYAQKQTGVPPGEAGTSSRPPCGLLSRAPDATNAGHRPHEGTTTGARRAGNRGQHGDYLDLRLPYRRSNRSMRPPVSTSFCLPV